MKNIVRVTHYIAFSGAIVADTKENRAYDAACYGAIVPALIVKADGAMNDHDKQAYAFTAGLYARNAARCARRSMD